MNRFRVRFWVSLSLLAFTVAAAPSCNEIINYPAPTLTAISPTSIIASLPAFTLTVTGENFTPASSVLWNGAARLTIFINTNQMTAQINASDIATPGTIQVEVSTPQPGGGVSSQLTFTIDTPPSPIPQITSVSPSGVFASGSPFALYVTGTNFVPLSMVTVNGDNRSTTFNNSTSLLAEILASDIQSSGTLQIAVVNPPCNTCKPPESPGGGSSNTVQVNVTNPVPSISSLTPVGLSAGGNASSLAVTGKGFVPNSLMTINGEEHTTIFASSTSLSIPLTAADLAVAGIDQIQVVSPTPGGGSSNIVTFAVDPTDSAGLPALVDLAPDGTQASNGICGGVANCSSGGMGLTLETAGPSASSSGEFIAFASVSNNLVTNLTSSSSEAFFRDTCLGVSACTPITLVISTGLNGSTANGPSSEPSLDSSGTHAVFTSLATNLAASVTVPGGTKQIYWTPVCNTRTTTTCPSSTSSSPSTTLVSISADGLSQGNADSYNPVISSDGRYVAFVSLATNLVTNLKTLNGATPQVLITDTCNGMPSTSCAPTTYLVSTPDGTTPGDGPSSHPSISTDGLYVSFTSSATNLGATAPNPGRVQEVFLRYTCVTTIATTTNSCSPVTTLISTPDGTTPADGSSGQSSVAQTGRFVAFASAATNLIAGVGPVQQIYMRDTCIGASTTCAPATSLVSSANGVTPANGLSESPSMNACTTTSCTAGQIVAFSSFATNLGASVANGVENVYVRNTCLGLTSSTTTATCTSSTALASLPSGPSPPSANGDSLVPSISGDGHVVAFLSLASNLVAGDNDSLEGIFLGSTTF
jgi:hypothetical protein